MITYKCSFCGEVEIFETSDEADAWIDDHQTRRHRFPEALMPEDVERVLKILTGAAIAREGDTVILTIPERMTQDQFEEIQKSLEEIKAGTGVKFVVLDGGLGVARIEEKT